MSDTRENVFRTNSLASQRTESKQYWLINREIRLSRNVPTESNHISLKRSLRGSIRAMPSNGEEAKSTRSRGQSAAGDDCSREWAAAPRGQAARNRGLQSRTIIPRPSTNSNAWPARRVRVKNDNRIVIRLRLVEAAQNVAIPASEEEYEQ